MTHAAIQYDSAMLLTVKPHPQLPVPTIVGDAVVDDEVNVLKEVLSREVAKLAAVLEGRQNGCH